MYIYNMYVCIYIYIYTFFFVSEAETRRTEKEKEFMMSGKRVYASKREMQMIGSRVSMLLHTACMRRDLFTCLCGCRLKSMCVRVCLYVLYASV